jgi:hypothetical protein
VDVFLPGSGGAQVHDLNPTQFPPVGLFWTVPIPVHGVEVDLANGTASMKATKVPIFDYGTLQNALFTGSNHHQFLAGSPSRLSGRAAW